MIDRSTGLIRARVRLGAAVAVALIGTLVVAVPADALGATRSDGCGPFAVAKAFVHAAAERRETTLGLLVSTLQARQDPWSLNAGQIAALQNASSGISALDAQVQNTCYTTRAALRADATQLFTNYRVYWLRVPQTHAVEAADRLAEARSRLGTVATKLAGHVGTNTKAQAELSAMNQALAAADANLGTVPTPADAVASVLTLAPAADMTADVAAMETARADLIAARGALIQARTDGLAVIGDLGA
ncbi:MAG: hypothetical protein ACLPVY_00725 [Acidimicrobiia bacterium]